MAWSSFAHLPINKEEYWYILSNLENDMTKYDIDHVIATYKGKEKVQHHYRSNLQKIGLFKIVDGRVMLSYDSRKLSRNRDLLGDVLNKALEKNQADEIKKVANAVMIIQSYDLISIVDFLQRENLLVERNNLVRWVRPIVTLLKIVDILSASSDKVSQYIVFLQEAYLKVAKGFNHSISLELVERELKKIDNTYSIIFVLENILSTHGIKFKIELLMMPRWATNNRSYKVGQDLYTHVKIKKDLLNGDENEKRHIARLL